MEAYKKGHTLRKRARANVWEIKIEWSKDELCKLTDELTKEIQEIRRSWVPTQNKDKDKEKEKEKVKDKDKKGKGRWMKKGDGVNKVTC